jgi:hypothetical protein
MKLPTIDQSIKEKLAEFDIWLTPTLGEIRDTDRFTQELDLVDGFFSSLAAATGDFADPSAVTPERVTHIVVGWLKDKSREAAYEILSSLCSTLFLVTGKSDNNAKCQLPIFLRDHAKWDSFPRVSHRRGKSSIEAGPIPRVLKSERYMAVVAELAQHPTTREKLLAEYVEFLLSTAQDIAQLWSLGKSYCLLRPYNKHRDLLTPIVVFQVRGSVSATGGHGPEELLRNQMASWGLRPGVDFNLCDVVVGDGGTSGGKTRAYDFVLPFAVESCKQRVFIQAQYYAGDSGSVSHKNVDQTATSRSRVKRSATDALFAEFVDGAGYFASLNKDLKSLLSMPDTAEFIQIRSSPIRLRRLLQSVGFATPLEVGHAVLAGHKTESSIVMALKADGYSEVEAIRALRAANESTFIRMENGNAGVNETVRAHVRRVLLLDTAARNGATLNGGAARGTLAIPGYGPFFGMKVDELARVALGFAPDLKSDWSAPDVILGDIRWLCEQGFAMAS